MSVSKKRKMMILAAAVVIPGGFVALGLWKAYELFKDRNKKKEEKINHNLWYNVL